MNKAALLSWFGTDGKPAENNKKPNQITSLQTLRGLAFLGIFSSHLGINVSDLGAWGVSVFFVLSGFLNIYIYIYQERELGRSISSAVSFSVKKSKSCTIFMLLRCLRH